ncbi:hypothetical protein [Streptodolium elevatio]|uniref:ABC transporter permease n=1 Tax=Streptodolium elevatio TaxID=3157996 RepID=A0ABV3DUD6_9ACTN
MTGLVVAALSAREVGRRRTAVLLVIALPLCFYLVRRDLPGQSTRLLAIGVGWAVATLTVFVVNASRSLDPRLRLAGASVLDIIGGRLLAMTGIGAALATAYSALVGVSRGDLAHPWGAVLMLLLTAVVAAPFGGLIAALLPRELEGALALLIVCATQLLADPAGSAAKLMPFWSARSLGNYTVDAAPTTALWHAVLHAAATWVLCTALTLAVFARRLRVARYPEP